jgi:hypothetical protein
VVTLTDIHIVLLFGPHAAAIALAPVIVGDGSLLEMAGRFLYRPILLPQPQLWNNARRNGTFGQSWGAVICSL